MPFVGFGGNFVVSFSLCLVYCLMCLCVERREGACFIVLQYALPAAVLNAGASFGDMQFPAFRLIFYVSLHLCLFVPLSLFVVSIVVVFVGKRYGDACFPLNRDGLERLYFG